MRILAIILWIMGLVSQLEAEPISFTRGALSPKLQEDFFRLFFGIADLKPKGDTWLLEAIESACKTVKTTLHTMNNTEYPNACITSKECSSHLFLKMHKAFYAAKILPIGEQWTLGKGTEKIYLNNLKVAHGYKSTLRRSYLQERVVIESFLASKNVSNLIMNAGHRETGYFCLEFPPPIYITGLFDKICEIKDVLFYEPSSKMWRVERTGVGHHVYGDLTNNLIPQVLSAERYDLIIATEVWEHLSDPMQSMKMVAALLKMDGVLLWTVPRWAPYHGVPSDHFRYTEKGVNLLARESRLDLVSMYNPGSLRTLSGGMQGMNALYFSKQDLLQQAKILWHSFATLAIFQKHGSSDNDENVAIMKELLQPTDIFGFAATNLSSLSKNSKSNKVRERRFRRRNRSSRTIDKFMNSMVKLCPEFTQKQWELVVEGLRVLYVTPEVDGSDGYPFIAHSNDKVRYFCESARACGAQGYARLHRAFFINDFLPFMCASTRSCQSKHKNVYEIQADLYFSRKINELKESNSRPKSCLYLGIISEDVRASLNSLCDELTEYQNNFILRQEHVLDLCKHKFDLVVLSNILESMHRPLEFLRKLRKCLEKSGILAFSAGFHLDDESVGGFWRFTRDSLQYLAHSSGFEVVELWEPGSLEILSGVLMGFKDVSWWSLEDLMKTDQMYALSICGVLTLL